MCIRDSQEGSARRGHDIPPAVRGWPCARRGDHVARNQQGNLRRMSPSTPSRASSWLAPAPPSVAIEIASRRITVVGLSANGAAIVSQAVEPLEAGAVMPALTGVNIPQPAIVADALRRALDRAGLRSTRRVALVIPDSVSRVSMLALEQVPAKASDLSQLIRLQLRKAMPFPIDDAVISHFEASRDTTAITIAAMAA